jgi:outer membrane protein OmpA-like peptidoglycan-associated protein
LPPIRNPAVPGARPRRNYYLPWVLLAIALIVVLLLATRSCSDRDDDRRDATAAPERGPVAAAPLAAEAVQLPNGRTVDLERDSMAYALQRFLQSDEPTPRAFVFDSLNFDTASAAIRPQDMATIDTLAEILRSYPEAEVTIMGYTDARGTAAGNAALGQLRADAVAAALAEKRVGKDRIEARSGGETQPVASNRRDAGRPENRRTELVVTAK